MAMAKFSSYRYLAAVLLSTFMEETKETKNDWAKCLGFP